MAAAFQSNAFQNNAFQTVAATRPGTIISFLAGRGIDRAEVERIRLQRTLQKKKRELAAIAKQVKATEKRTFVPNPPAGILANLHLLEAKKQALEVELAGIVIDLAGVKDLINSMTAESFDDDDEDFMDFMTKVDW